LVKAPLAYLLVYRIGPSFCCLPPRKTDSVRNFGGLGQPFRTSRSRQGRATTFFAKAKEKNCTDIAPKNPSQAIVSAGNDDFPPSDSIVKRKGKWYFDTKAGCQEILNRIGASELTPLRCVAGFVEAQKELRPGKA
jgi:hypothetical protein